MLDTVFNTREMGSISSSNLPIPRRLMKPACGGRADTAVRSACAEIA